MNSNDTIANTLHDKALAVTYATAWTLNYTHLNEQLTSLSLLAAVIYTAWRVYRDIKFKR